MSGTIIVYNSSLHLPWAKVVHTYQVLLYVIQLLCTLLVTLALSKGCTFDHVRYYCMSDTIIVYTPHYTCLRQRLYIHFRYFCMSDTIIVYPPRLICLWQMLYIHVWSGTIIMYTLHYTCLGHFCLL